MPGRKRERRREIGHNMHLKDEDHVAWACTQRKSCMWEEWRVRAYLFTRCSVLCRSVFVVRDQDARNGGLKFHQSLMSHWRRVMVSRLSNLPHAFTYFVRNFARQARREGLGRCDRPFWDAPHILTQDSSTLNFLSTSGHLFTPWGWHHQCDEHQTNHLISI